MSAGTKDSKEVLSWASIQLIFKGQWVELVDVEWEANPGKNSGHPLRARVRNFASGRSELLKKVGSRALEDSSIMFVTPLAALSKMVKENQVETPLF